MNDPRFIKPETVPLKMLENFNEAKLKEIIVEDPSILGLGQLKVRNTEKILPGTGRVDLILYDQDYEEIRYEAELQLGKTDESHIIRCLEYWDIERKRYPTYDHTAVLIAEDITSRFLNVISLFNGAVPLIALRLTALKIGDQIALSFTKVLDKVVQEDEGPEPEPKNRTYWLKKSTEDLMSIVDADAPIVSCKSILGAISPAIDLKYNAQYIGICVNGVSKVFANFVPRASFLKISVRFKQPDNLDAWKDKLDKAGLITTKINTWLSFSLRKREDLEQHASMLKELFNASYQMLDC